jgi:hypothetical protein
MEPVQNIGGNHRFTFTDGTNIITLDFSMDSTAPPTPSLLSPASSSKASATPTLKWQNVSDPSGVTYSLEISTDSAFSIPELQKDGLKQSEYTLTSQEILGNVSKDAPYYWRVKAIDGADNQSDWSTPSTFNVAGCLIKEGELYIYSSRHLCWRRYYRFLDRVATKTMNRYATLAYALTPMIRL